jgi:hypothetical protein
MGWLAERAEQRTHPQVLWPEARSVVALGLSYAPGFDALENLARQDRGTISVYARNRDYHDVLRGKLKHLAQFMVSRFGGDVKVFVDTAPVMEKPLAEAAGLGWQGKHTKLAVPGRGLYHDGTFGLREIGRRVRDMHAVFGGLPNGCVSGAIPAGCDAVYFVSDDRASGCDPIGIAPAHGQPDLWVRRLPGGVSLEPVRAPRPGREVAAAG